MTHDQGKSRTGAGPGLSCLGWLEMEGNIRGQGAGGDEVRAAEGGKKVIQAVFIRYIYAG